jgi:micrococcal nuclease
MKRRFRRPWWTWLVWLALGALIGWRIATAPRLDQLNTPLASGPCQVERVIDGDTLLLSSGNRVRLIGVDTPETVMPDHPVERFGPEATLFTRTFLGEGAARLEFDRERLDRHGRHLAYVWIGERMLNEELLRAGLARFEPQYHYSEAVKRRFRRAQDEAQRAQRGLWSSSGR